MNGFSSFLERFGSNFLVAAMIPSLGLVIACLVVFDPIFHISAAFQIENGIYSLLGISLLVMVPSVVVGFTLTALNTFILKLFEGYIFFHHFPFMKRAYVRKANKLIKQREILKKDIEALEHRRNRSPRDDTLLNAYKTEYYVVTATYDQSYSPPDAEIMPTKFGNILKASEAYSGTRYGIDAVQFWPRLLHVIPQSYRQIIDDARNELSFLVNMSALTIIFFFLCVLAMFVNIYSFGPYSLTLLFQNAFRYVSAGAIALALNWFFNKAALFSVGDYGVMIRSAYDLFRLDLLEQFRLKHPKDSIEEFQVWKNLGELIVLGQESLDFKPLEYEIKK